MRAAAIAIIALLTAACGLAPSGTAASVTARLPAAIGGLTVPYHENAVADLGPQRDFFDAPVEAVGGDPATARVAIGSGPRGLTLTALVVPGADARRLVEPLIAAAGTGAFNRSRALVGGKDVLLLTQPASTPSRVHVYATGDMVVLLDTVDPALGEEVFRALP